MMKTTRVQTTLLYLIIVLTIFGLACNEVDTRDIDVVVSDMTGAPIESALVYVESFELNDGAIDFAWGYTDALGQPHTSTGAILSIGWSSTAHLACASFSPGTRPAVYLQRAGVADPGQIHLLLEDTATAALDFQPTLAKLSFPFLNQPDLAERLNDSINLPLVATFWSAYEPILGGTLPTTEEERRKAAAIDTIWRSH